MIKWITDTVGTAPWGQASATDEVRILDVRDLVDRGGNFSADVRQKIDEGVEGLSRGGRLVVCCDYGISRSNAIAAGVIAIAEGIDLDDAIARVFQETGEDSIKLEMLATVRRCLEREQDPVRPSAVVLTGGSGFVGRKLLSRLGARAEVVAPTRAEADLTRASLILDRLVRQRHVGTLVHLAHPRVVSANISVGEAVTAMKNVLDVCAENQLRLVYLSGWEVFSGYRSTEPLVADESLPALPGSTYGFSKALCESLAQQMSAQRGFPLCLIRSGPVFGLGSDRPHFIRTYVDEALRGSPVVVHRYRNDLPRLDLMPVDDLVGGIASAVEREAEGIFHLGTGSLTSTTDVAQRVIRVLSSAGPISVRDIDSDVCNVAMDSAKAGAELAWSPGIDPLASLDKLIADIAGQDPASRRQPTLRTDDG